MNKMNCRHVVNRLSAYLDGELAGDEMIEIRRHVDRCQACETELAVVRKTKLLLSRLRTAVPREALLSDIAANLDRTPASKLRCFWDRHRSMFFGRIAKTSMVTALGGLLIFAFYFQGMQEHGSEFAVQQSIARGRIKMGHFASLPDVPGIPYCIGTDEPLQLVVQGNSYSSGQPYEIRSVVQAISSN